MKVKMVLFDNGKYAIRKGWLFKRYADLMDLRDCDDDIFWWENTEEYIKYFTTPSLTDLEDLISGYNKRKELKVPQSKESSVMQIITLK